MDTRPFYPVAGDKLYSKGGQFGFRYLNYIKYGADWGYVDEQNMRDRGMYYECDPTNFTGTATQKVLFLYPIDLCFYFRLLLWEGKLLSGENLLTVLI